MLLILAIILLIICTAITLYVYYFHSPITITNIDYNLKPVKLVSYQKEDLPLVVYYAYCPIRHSNLYNEYKIIKKAIDHINTSTGIKFFSLMKPGTVPNNIHDVLLIRDVSGKHEGCTDKFDGPFGTLAHAYFPPVKKICLDNEEPWTNKQLHYTLVHELLHSLGMTHIHVPHGQKAIMHRFYDSSINGMQPLDIYHLKKLYPFL